MMNSSVLQCPQRRWGGRMPSTLLALLILASGGVASGGAGAPAMAGDVKSDSQRSLELQELRGAVTYKGGQTRPAQVGDRLVAGEGITTGKKSSAIVVIDHQIGIIKVSENTDFRVRKLEVANGGNITLVSVNRGQVALRIRPFTNPASRLEIRTPSGVSGVRGTEFGVAVAPSGSTAILTSEGSVAASAQGQTVLVTGGYSSMIYPGDAPTPPRPTVETVDLALKTVQRYRSRLIRIVGQVDPINMVFYQDQPLAVGRDGTFSLQLLTSQSNALTLRVRTPLGREKEHTVWVP